MSRSGILDDADADLLDYRLQAYHFPFQLVFDTVYTDWTGIEILGWSGIPDAALWTGCYLAAEAFRYAVTQSSDALNYALAALDGIRKLSLISGKDHLARYVYPVNGEHVDYFELHKDGSSVKRTLDGVEYYYAINTTRDQFAGVFFGLAVAFNLIPNCQDIVKDIVTRLTRRLIKDHWWMTWKNTFLFHEDKQLSILQVARHVNADFEKDYSRMRKSKAKVARLVVLRESSDRYNSYYKYNIMALYLFNLVGLEEHESGYRNDYLKAYAAFRQVIGAEENAHFNAIDSALTGRDPAREAQTAALLDQLLNNRGFESKSTDVGNEYGVCGSNRSCLPIDVPKRTFDQSFVWQVTPYTLKANGNGSEDPAVSYLLPYWMTRYYTTNTIHRP